MKTFLLTWAILTFVIITSIALARKLDIVTFCIAIGMGFVGAVIFWLFGIGA